MKQTAVEWIVEQLTPSISLQQKHIDNLKNEAKAMEKQQIISTYRDGRSDQQSKEGRFYNRNAEYYYNQNFKIEEKCNDIKKSI